MELTRFDELHQRGEVGAADTRARSANGEGEQRVRGDVDTEACRPDGIVTQRREGASPWRSQCPRQHEREHDDGYESKVEKLQCPGELVPEQRRPRYARHAKCSSCDSLLVTKEQIHQHIEA